jgi:opacity protein-like surface antigen
MKSTIFGALLCMAAQAVSASEQAPEVTQPELPAGQGGLYIGVGAGLMDYSERGVYADSLDYVYLLAGWKFNRHFALEARAGRHTSDAAIEFDVPQPVEVKITSLVGVYGRAMLPLSDRWELYALAGYSSMKLKATVVGESSRDTKSSLSYGAGITWRMDFGLAFELEYLPAQMQGNGWHGRGLNLGLRIGL